MKKLVCISLMLPAFMYAQGLKQLLTSALENNNMVSSRTLMEQSRKKTLEASKSSYFPTLDISGGYQSLNQRSYNTPGDTYNGSIGLGFDIYDGGYKSNTIKQNKKLVESAKFATSSYKKSLQLSVIEDFYNIKNTQSTIKALQEEKIQLQAELERITQFFQVGSATKDEVDKLQARLSNNLYQIETAKYQLLSLKKLLSIKVGMKINSVDDSSIIPPKFTDKELSDEIKSLMATAKSYEYTAKSINSGYMPNFRLEDTYSVYDYDRTDVTHPEGLSNQNKLLLSFSMRLYDDGNIKKQKESVMLQKLSLEKEIQQSKDEQDTNVELAISKIQTAKAQIQSAKSTLESAKSAYKTILEKYKVGAVDNVAYLDALTTQTNAMAQYDTALNDLQVAYANYYYYVNKNIKDYVK
jgi:outer membrane protein TolC